MSFHTHTNHVLPIDLVTLFILVSCNHFANSYHVKDPDMGYWLQRTDTSATVRYDPTTRTIQYQVPCAEPKGLYNAETYNSPCCIPNLEKICSGIYNNTMVKDDECQSSKPPFELQLCEVVKAVCKENPNRYGNCNLIRNDFIIDNLMDQGIEDSYWNIPYRFGNFSIDVRNEEFHNGSREWGL